MVCPNIFLLGHAGFFHNPPWQLLVELATRSAVYAHLYSIMPCQVNQRLRTLSAKKVLDFFTLWFTANWQIGYQEVEFLVVDKRLQVADRRHPIDMKGWVDALVCLTVTAASLTSVMAFSAVSEPMLRSEPGILLDTVAGTMTIGTQNSLYLSRADDSSSNPM